MNTKTIKISEFDSKKHKVVLDRYGKGFAAHKVAHIRLSEKNSRLGKYLVTIDFGVGQQPISWDQNDDLISVVEEEISITNTKISFTRNFKAAVFLDAPKKH
jgi:NAD dependent epimerase/dehydratase family enzyme